MTYAMPEDSKRSIGEKQRISWASGTRKPTTLQDRQCKRCEKPYTPRSANTKFCGPCRTAGPLVIQTRNSRQWCTICQRDLTPINRAADHCHTSGFMRGVLCTNCNVALGMLGDDPKVYLAAWAYMAQWVDLIGQWTPAELAHRIVYDPVAHKTWTTTQDEGE